MAAKLAHIVAQSKDLTLQQQDLRGLLLLVSLVLDNNLVGQLLPLGNKLVGQLLPLGNKLVDQLPGTKLVDQLSSCSCRLLFLPGQRLM